MVALANIVAANFSQMVPVPTPIKKVFDAFPLVEYGNIPSTTSVIEDSINSQKLHFSGPATDDIFTLNVFEIFHYNQVLIPTDPFSLAVTLNLCKKNHLKLPRPESKGTSSHSIMKTSYQASPNGALPVLVEDSTSREILLASDLKKSLRSSVLPLLSDLLDSDLYDLWLMAIYFESDKVDLTKIFGIDSPQLTKYTLLEDLKQWNFFSIRYPHLNQSVYESKLERCKHLLSQIEEVDEVNLIKIYAFVIIVDSLMDNTKLGTIIPSNLVENANDYINSM